MTQRIFDVDNPQDVKDLFDILPDKIKKIMRNLNAFDCYDKDGEYIYSCYFFSINWRDKTGITRPVGESQWIGKLCWFWVDNEESATIGLLGRKTPGGNYQEGTTNKCYPYCRPVRRDEIKFVEDEK